MTPSYTQVRDWMVQNGFEIKDGMAHTDTLGSIIVKPHPAVEARVDYALGLDGDRDRGLSLWVNTPWLEVGPDTITRSITDPVYIWCVPGDCNPTEALEKLGEVLTAELQEQLRCTEMADRTSESLIAMSAMLGCHGAWALERIANQLYRHLEKLARDDDGDQDDGDDDNPDEDDPTPIGPAPQQLVISANGRHRLNGVLHA
jgi:hypothetical protein